MRTTIVLAALAAAVACAPTHAASPPSPVVVELFTSEGCSSCPPADTLLQQLADESPNVIALGQHVDYWDQLGWRDRFSSAALTQRQQVYGSQFNLESVYTPQMVVDGRAEFVGSDATAARRAIERAGQAAHARVGLAIESGPDADRIVHAAVTVSGLPSPGKGDHADVLLAVTEDHLRSDVKRGENRGRTLAHAAVVRRLTVIGDVTPGSDRTLRADVPLAADWRSDQLKLVAFVQERRGRGILGAAAVKLAAQ